MWMVPTQLMCRKHLLGEHVEIHMLIGSLSRKKSITGFINNGLLEPSKIKSRHDAIVAEMESRGYNHKTPINNEEVLLDHLSYLPEAEYNAKVDIAESLTDLIERCPECRENFYKHYKGE